MKKTSIKILIFLILIILISGFWFSKREKPIKENQEKISVYFSPTCGCCFEYTDYLKRQGFNVEKVPTYDVLSIKEKFKIPNELESCHTSVIGNYFVEGHVPIEAINKLLVEKPAIGGISLPGMPAGSPGMGGIKKGLFKIYSLTDGQALEFMEY